MTMTAGPDSEADSGPVSGPRSGPVSPPISLWEISADEPVPPTAAALPDRVDLAIVGGGYSGLSTALHAAQAGLSAHVIEAQGLGHGGSGRNVGLVNAGSWLPPSEVREKLGQKAGERFLHQLGAAPQAVFDLIERHQIRCEPVRNGTIHAAHAPSGLRNLTRRWQQWSDLGAPVDLLDATAMEKATGSRRFPGGLLDRRAGTVNPMGYCLGLARVALAAGAGISTGLSATGLTPEAGGWRVQTDQGSLWAAQVVLATNAYTGRLWPGLHNTYTTIHFFQLATPPLGPEAAHILPGGQGLWDTGQVMFSLRRDARGRLIVGSMGRVIGGLKGGLSQRWAAARIRRLFPELGPVAFDEAWDGRIAMTPDHIPRIHRLAPGLYTPIGYNGRGITTGTIFGQAIAGLLTGAAADTLPLPLSAPRRDVGAPLKARMLDLAFAANQAIRGF